MNNDSDSVLVWIGFPQINLIEQILSPLKITLPLFSFGPNQKAQDEDQHHKKTEDKEKK